MTIAGKYDYVSGENYDAYLKAVGKILRILIYEIWIQN